MRRRKVNSHLPSWCIEIACGHNRKTCRYAIQDDDGSIPVGTTPDGETVWRSIILYFPGPDCPMRKRGIRHA